MAPQDEGGAFSCCICLKSPNPMKKKMSSTKFFTFSFTQFKCIYPSLLDTFISDD